MLPDCCAMGIDSNSSLSWPPTSQRRINLTPARLRLKEERKRIIRALDAKYRTIDVHERGIRRFVLIRNNLLRLQREAREEKLARHRTNMTGSKVSNLSPSCLSASRPRSPSPPCHYGFSDSLTPPFTGMASSLFGDDPPAKRPRLFFHDDKENEMDVDNQEPFTGETKDSSLCRPADDAQEILRDLYETCVSEGIAQRPPCPVYSSGDFSQEQPQTSYSFSMSASCNVSSGISNSSCSSSSSNSNNTSADNCENEWPRHSQYPFNCGHSSLLGNDLQSVVFHSLITSLES